MTQRLLNTLAVALDECPSSADAEALYEHSLNAFFNECSLSALLDNIYILSVVFQN